jgi:hypothetical protein
VNSSLLRPFVREKVPEGRMRGTCKLLETIFN